MRDTISPLLGLRSCELRLIECDCVWGGYHRDRRILILRERYGKIRRLGLPIINFRSFVYELTRSELLGFVTNPTMRLAFEVDL